MAARRRAERAGALPPRTAVRGRTAGLGSCYGLPKDFARFPDLAKDFYRQASKAHKSNDLEGAAELFRRPTTRRVGSSTCSTFALSKDIPEPPEDRNVCRCWHAARRVAGSDPRGGVSHVCATRYALPAGRSLRQPNGAATLPSIIHMDRLSTWTTPRSPSSLQDRPVCKKNRVVCKLAPRRKSV